MFWNADCTSASKVSVEYDSTWWLSFSRLYDLKTKTSVPLLPDYHWPGVVVIFWSPSMGQTCPFDIGNIQWFLPKIDFCTVYDWRPSFLDWNQYKITQYALTSNKTMEQILLAYGLPKETVAAIMILYRNTKVKVRSPDGDTEYFDIVAGVLQGDKLAPYLFIICLDYVLRTSIDKIRENGFQLTKRRSKRYPAKTITDADYADDLALLANTPNQAETLLHSLERAAAGIGLHVNANKTEYMCYNQTGNIATLDGASLKLVDKFTYLGSSVSSTEKDIDTRLTKAWTAIDRLSIIWKSDLTDKMKRSFFQAAVVSILLYGCTTWTLTKRLERRLDGNYTRMLRAVLNKSWRQHPTRLQLMDTCPPSQKLYKFDEPDTQDTAGEARTSS